MTCFHCNRTQCISPKCGVNKLNKERPFPNEEVEELGLMVIPDPDEEDASHILPNYEKLVAAGRRSLSWLASYPGGGGLPAYDEMRLALPVEELLAHYKERPDYEGATVDLISVLVDIAEAALKYRCWSVTVVERRADARTLDNLLAEYNRLKER